MNEIKYISIDDEIPADKNKLCIFFDGDYYIDTYNNLSSTDQKQLLKWSYLPLIDEINIAHDDYDSLKDKINKIKDWTKDNIYDDGCIDCDFTETDKLLDILREGN